MKFLRADREEAQRAIAETIRGGLRADKRVLWLTSGGSNIPTQKAVMDMVRESDGKRLGGLAILPVDERYGKPGHADSNIQQLRDAGFDPGGATLVDVLMHDLPFDQTVSFYNEVLLTALANAAVVIGQFGMGPDGHIAGIKPDSPAAEPGESAAVIGYEWNDYRRLTLMPAALRQVTDGFLLAYGADRKRALTALQKRSLSFQKLPAVLLCELPEVCVYSDQIGRKG